MTGRLPAPARGGGAPVRPAGEAWRHLVAAWLAGYGGHTRAAYARDVADWTGWCAGHDLAPLAVVRAHVDLYARQLAELRGAAPATVARRLAALAGVYGYAVDDGQLAANPVVRVRRPKAGADSPTTGLSRDQLRVLLAAAAADSPRAAALLTLLAYTGLRVGEALAADVADLAVERGHRVLHVVRKGGRRALTVLAAPTVRTLEGYLAGRDSGPLFITRSGRRFDQPAAFRLIRRLARAAGLPQADRISPHSLRHTFVTLALDAGASLRDVQDAAGHADPRTTRRYDRARHRLDRHPTYTLTGYLAADTDG